MKILTSVKVIFWSLYLLKENDFESFSSWGEIKDLSKFEKLPNNLKKYIIFIEEYLKIPIKIISLGPERNQTIIR